MSPMISANETNCYVIAPYAQLTTISETAVSMEPTKKPKGRTMDRDGIQHALDTIYGKVFNQGQADLYPADGQRPVYPTQPAFPEWTRCDPGVHQAGRSHPLRGQTRRHRWRPGLRPGKGPWTGEARKPPVCGNIFRFDSEAKWSSTGTCCNRYQPPPTTQTPCSRTSDSVEHGDRLEIKEVGRPEQEAHRGSLAFSKSV